MTGHEGDKRLSSGSGSPPFDPRDILRQAAGRMSKDRQEIVRRLGKAKSHYVESGRDAYIAEKFERFIEEIFAELDDGRRDEGRVFTVTGPSGAGKTRLIAQLLSNSADLQSVETSYGVVHLAISLRLSGPCTLGTLGRRILTAAGYPIRKESAAKRMWEEMSGHLMTRGITLIHLDETQHMVHLTEKDQDRKDLAKALKDVVSNREWPVSFLLTGLPHTNEIARLDKQIARRGYFIELPPLDPEVDRELIAGLAEEISQAAAVDGSHAIAGDMPERIAHAASYQFGWACQIMIGAIHEALKEGATTLTRMHFARAYWARSHSVPNDNMNPFLVDDFDRIEPGSFINSYGDET